MIFTVSTTANKAKCVGTCSTVWCALKTTPSASTTPTTRWGGASINTPTPTTYIARKPARTGTKTNGHANNVKWVAASPCSVGLGKQPGPDRLGLWKGQPRNTNGTFGKGANPEKPCPPVVDPTKKVHGNSLDSDAPAIGYTLRDINTEEVMKYGELRRKKRYSTAYLKSETVTMDFEETGTKREMHRWQHEKILDHKVRHDGRRPRLNKSTY